MTKLFAVGFPRELDELQLAQLFAPYGDIELLTILRDQDSGKSKGCGFIHMKTESGALEAIAALNPTRNTSQRQIPKQPQANPPQKKKRPRISR